MIRRPPRSTLSSSSAASDVYKRQLLYLGTRVELPDLRWRLAMEKGFIVAAGFGLAQWAFGIEQTKIPGLTIALGDTYATKNDVIFTGDGQNISKIMSTYQNGNIFGVVAAVFLIVSIARISDRKAARHDWLLFFSSGLAVSLSGSRTALVVAVVGIVLVFMRRGNMANKLWVGVGVVVSYGMVVWLEPALASRYTIGNLVASGGAGRTLIWARTTDAMTL